MRWYADAPWWRARQITADLLMLAWVLGWVLVGRWVHALVMNLARPADPLRDAGTALQDRMSEVASRVGEIPLAGDRLEAPFTGVAGVGTDLVSAGDRLQSSVETVALLVSLLSAGTPILIVVLVWLAVRLAWVRKAAALSVEVADPESQELLALRALVRQHPRRLQRLCADPVGAWRSGDPDALRALADLELSELGLRSRPTDREARQRG